jgi:hypothetical protein
MAGNRCRAQVRLVHSYVVMFRAGHVIRLAAGTGVLLAMLCVGLAVGPAPARALTFSDVPLNRVGALQIEVAAQLGVAEGFADGLWRPEEPVTRQQFAKMVVLAMRLPVSELDVCPFGDVPSSGPDSFYPDNYVAAAYRAGIITGTRAATAGVTAQFSPDAHISLAQVVTMITRAAGVPLDQPPAAYMSAWGPFSPVHGPAARLAQYNGLLREFSQTGVDPWRDATRAEAAALLFNLMGTDPQGLNGRFLGTSGDLVAYFRSKAPSGEKFTVPLEQLARLYITYGRRFGIRADMAWAQMVHETGFGRYGGSVKPEQNNFAGIGATGPGVPGNSFATAELGVIAQYAHLAWYIYPEHLADPYCRMSTDPNVPGDPRHFADGGSPHRANVRTVLDLSQKWAVGSEYGEALLEICRAIPRSHVW